MVNTAGVDTWSVCWYLKDDGPAAKALEALATEPAARSKMLPEPIAGHRVGWFPGPGLLYAEGHPNERGLAGADGLVDGFDQLTQGMADVGILPPEWAVRSVECPGEKRREKGGYGFAGIRRLDSTVDMRFDNPLEGLAALAGVAALPMPRIKKGYRTECGGRRLETVYLYGYSGKKVLARMYDKGTEQGGGKHERGAWVRPEDQRRFTAETRPPLDAVASTAYVRDSFVRRFEPLWKAAKGVKVGAPMDLAKRLGEMQRDGDLTPTEAKRLAGHLLLDAAGAQHQSRATCMRDRADCRRHGLVLAGGIFDEVEIDLGDIFEQALDDKTWGQG